MGGYLFAAQPGGGLGWFGGYFNSYFQTLAGQINPNPLAAIQNMLIGILVYGDTSMYDTWVTPGMNFNAHAAGRTAANTNMLVPGSPQHLMKLMIELPTLQSRMVVRLY